MEWNKALEANEKYNGKCSKCNEECFAYSQNTETLETTPLCKNHFNAKIYDKS